MPTRRRFLLRLIVLRQISVEPKRPNVQTSLNLIWRVPSSSSCRVFVLSSVGYKERAPFFACSEIVCWPVASRNYPIEMPFLAFDFASRYHSLRIQAKAS